MAAITVILSTYNRPEFLRRAVASLTRQTFEDWRLLAYDMSDRAAAQETFDALSDRRIEKQRLPGVMEEAEVNNPILDDLTDGLCIWMCDNNEYHPILFSRAVKWFFDNPQYFSGYVYQQRDLWTPDGATRTGPASDSNHWNVLPPTLPVPIDDALGILDHSQVIHRLPCAARWNTPQEVNDRRVDGHYLNNLIACHGPIQPISDTILSFEHMAYRE